MPSPESPAKRTMTLSTCSICFAIVVGIARRHAVGSNTGNVPGPGLSHQAVVGRSSVRSGRSPDDLDAPGAAALEQFVGIDLVAPAQEVRLGLVVGRAVH